MQVEFAQTAGMRGWELRVLRLCRGVGICAQAEGVQQMEQGGSCAVPLPPSQPVPSPGWALAGAFD